MNKKKKPLSKKKQKLRRKKQVVRILSAAVLLGVICAGPYYVGKKYFFDKDVDASQEINKSYTVELSRFKIKNNGTDPIQTSKGINEALEYAKGKGYKEIVFPKGTYLIDEKNPVTIDVKDMVINLNDSTFQINTNGQEKYYTVVFKDGAENVRLTNGTIRGDRDTHDYKTIKTPHEWGHGLVFDGGQNLDVDHLTITNVTGYGVYTRSGNDANRFDAIKFENLESGNISDDGISVDDGNSIRTKEAYDISKVGGKFELGYTLGYQGYPSFKNKEYTAYFYDKDNKFLEKKDCIQFKKTEVPKDAVYVKFAFPQSEVVEAPVAAAWISNFKPPTNVKLMNCDIKKNRSLGLGFCGGQDWRIEGNTFEDNGGNAPGFAVDFEDGWNLMQNVTFKNNVFKNNHGDLTSAAGDNFVFEGNDFTNTVYIWHRTTDYKILNNEFNNSKVTYEYSTPFETRGNTYNNSELRLKAKEGTEVNPLIHKEIFINSSIEKMAPNEQVIDSDIRGTKGASIRLAGNIKKCNINVKKSYLMGDLDECNIEGSELSVLEDSKITNGTIKDSQILNHGRTGTIALINNKINNSQVLLNTWGSHTILDIENNEINMDKDSFIKLSAGKMKDLLFKNNAVNNTSDKKPVLNMYDTTYSQPNGNATIEGNTFTQTKYPYVFDGVNIKSGIFNFDAKDNTLNNCEIINEKYNKNPNFNMTIS
ncbi:right-handed parallel beta-helix repeat-containing protein [Clostridium tarantellae]|uniref:right-handed parallel beta-helix repeat-containing protein n=1 Tax=Clostridium tarantellae TaxID=39493 RepID=UPI0014792081|nr:right-handed parallel beta-helix repeat-containing protein [Clostridium tarantellae]